MYILIAGGGKVGANLARTLLKDGKHEVTLIEQRRDRFERLEHEFEHQVLLGDATEIYVLERAGIARPPDVVAALTGDDEDNLIICQLSREKYGVEKVIARVNDPRNQAHFDLLGISPTVSATRGLMALIEHEVPEHDLVHLLELRKENLEIVEVQIPQGAPAAGKRVERLEPAGGLAPDLDHAQRPLRDRGRLDRAPARRPGAGDPSAGQGGRVAEGPAQDVIRVAGVLLVLLAVALPGAACGQRRLGLAEHAPVRPRLRLAGLRDRARAASRASSTWSSSRA